MSSTKVCLVALCVALVVWGAQPADAQEAILAWEDPNRLASESFLITYIRDDQPGKQQQFRVKNGGRASCDGVPNQHGLAPQSVCGRTPECLAPGIYSFWIQAERGGRQSRMATPVANCEAKAGCQYTCDQVTLPPDLAALLPSSAQTSPQAVDTAALEQVMQTLAQVPPPRSVPPPASAADDTLDTVQPALDALAITPG
jgi:hypothetical protein